MALTIAIVGTREDQEFGVQGKMSDEHLLPFRQALSDRGVDTVLARYDEVADLAQDVAAAIFVYAEVRAEKFPKTRQVLTTAAEAARVRGIHVIHPPSLGRIVANKALTSDVLVAAGVPMPRRVVSAVPVPFPVFSNVFMSTQAPIEMVAAGERLDPGRYNTEWIDTRHEFAGRRYFVSLRLMAVGRHRVATLIRARSTEQGNPSVHTRDTPLDPALLNHLHQEIVMPRSAELDALCERVAASLGFGFFGHDLLVERDAGRVLLCESGFKFEDDTYRKYIGRIGDQLSYDDGLPPGFAKRSADRFADELPNVIARTR